MKRDSALLLTVLSLAFAAGCASENGDEDAFLSDWTNTTDRVWTGADYWANPLEDWLLRDGRLENVAAGGDRNVFLLTREVANRAGDLELSVRLGPLQGRTIAHGEGWVGFRVGIRGALGDYRDSAVRGVGTDVGVATEDGRLFIGTLEENAPTVPVSLSELDLVFRVEPIGERIHAVLEARNLDQELVASIERTDLDPAWLTGGLALVSSSGTLRETPGPTPVLVETGWSGKEGTQRGGAVRFWFRHWKVSGSRVEAHPGRSWGPILFAMHTLDRGRLKLTAQLAPITPSGPLALEVQSGSRGEGQEWTEVPQAPIETDSRTATFSVEEWDASADVPYRVVYTDTQGPTLDLRRTCSRSLFRPWAWGSVAGCPRRVAAAGQRTTEQNGSPEKVPPSPRSLPELEAASHHRNGPQLRQGPNPTLAPAQPSTASYTSSPSPGGARGKGSAS